MNKEYIKTIMKNRLFAHIDEQECTALFGCLDSEVKSYAKGETLILQGETSKNLGIVLKGHVHLVRYDYYGRAHPVATCLPSDSFGEVYALNGSPFALNVEAGTDCVVLYVEIVQLSTMCHKMCSFHNQLIQNMLILLSKRNEYLNRKLTYITQPTLRDKILMFLKDEASKAHSQSVTIDMNRQQLADYLNCDRSALSNELSKMASEGLITYHKNHFQLIEVI